VEWASRWDLYLSMTNETVHWFSIINSLVMVLLIGAILARILLRTVQQDLESCVNDQYKSQVRTQSYDIWNVQ
jgi:uncharacterized membrane-anchored protein YhcB (DUF1043 family)